MKTQNLTIVPQLIPKTLMFTSHKSSELNRSPSPHPLTRSVHASHLVTDLLGEDQLKEDPRQSALCDDVATVRGSR